MRTMHLFAGAGGGLLADLILGHKPICAVEWEPYACEVLRQRSADGWFPNLRVWEGDVRLFNPSKYAGKVDCLNAGFPCTDISVAGNQAGIGEDTRSGLYREVLRIADEVRPQFIFLENVAAIVTGADGGWLRTIVGDLAERGFDAVWCCLSAAEVGAKHKRNRWWLLARRRAIPSHTELQRSGWREQQSCGFEKEAGNVGYASSNGRKTRGNDNGKHDGAIPPANGQYTRSVAYTARQSGHGGRTHRENGESQTSELGSDGCAGNVPNTKSSHCGGLPERAQAEDSVAGDCGDILAYTDQPQLQRDGSTESGERSSYSSAWRPCCFCLYEFDHDQLGKYGCPNCEGEAEPGLGGMADDVANRMDANAWNETEAQVGRVTDEKENRAARLKTIGNGQCCLQASVAFSYLWECMEATA